MRTGAQVVGVTAAERSDYMKRVYAEAKVAGVTGVQRNLFQKRLYEKMLPLVRSGRLGRADVQAYRAELVSLPIPAWLGADSGTVLTALARVVEHPNYQYEQSLAGDFGGLGGIFDTIASVASTVWGAGKAAVKWGVTAAPVVGQIAETITSTAPVAETIWQERETIIAAAPVATQVYDVGSTVVAAAQEPLVFGLSPLMLGGIALAAWLVFRK